MDIQPLEGQGPTGANTYRRAHIRPDDARTLEPIDGDWERRHRAHAAKELVLLAALVAVLIVLGMAIQHLGSQLTSP